MDENLRLLQEYDRLPKVAIHGQEINSRHPDISPEWVTRIINEPYDQWEETDHRTGELRTILIGRVMSFHQWIKVVFSGVGAFRKLLTNYPDRRLAQNYGGRPWEIQQ